MASFLVLWTMYRIDPVSVLFVFCPLIGNFLFGNLKNKFEYMRYQEEAPKDKVLNYVNRVLYLPDYAKEIRLSEVFRLLKRQYNEATDEKSDLAGKYAWRIGSMNVLWHFFTFTVMFEGVLLFAIYKNLVIGSMSLADLTVMSSLMVAATWILIGLFNSVMETMKNGLFICNLWSMKRRFRRIRMAFCHRRNWKAWNLKMFLFPIKRKKQFRDCLSG